MVPAMLTSCLMLEGVNQRDFAALECIIYGASPISENMLNSAMETFGCDFVQIYGMTETHGMITMLGPEDHRRATLPDNGHLISSCGRATADTEVKVLSPNGEACDVGESGEIVCRGQQNMLEYWRRPHATAATIKDDWLHTGDAGYRDDEGYFFIVDRIKDIIVSGGENIAPSEIEGVLDSFPEVLECSVIGVPHEQWGEAVAAIIVLREGARLNESDVKSRCRSNLAGFKIPKTVDFIDALPRNGSGKVLKTELRKPHWQGANRAVS
jgi:long-chain acyl-CoA synthetase